MWRWEADEQPKAVVAIIHSAYEEHRWYAWLIEKLRSSGFHVVMGDLPGHGDGSKYARYHDEDFDDYKSYTTQLFKVALEYDLPLFVIGHGLGAIIAMRVLQKGKIECAGLILTSPWLHLKLAPGKMSNALTSFSAITSNVKIKHELTLLHFTRNVDSYSELSEHFPLKNTVTVSWYRDIQQAMRQLRDPERLMPNIPLLLMTGRNDKVIDHAAVKQWLLQQKLTEFQYKEWPNCLHALYFEQEREEAYCYTEDFMKNVLRSLGYIMN
ncbi:MAG: alpha/beta hydrolase [Solibacillus sp.]